MSSEQYDVEFRAAWRKGDPALERDATAFWGELKLLPSTATVEDRLKELCAVAYSGDKVVAVSTAVAAHLKSLRSNLAMYRCAVSPQARQKDVATRITLFSRDVLEEWSLAHPEERLMGLGTIVQSRLLIENLPQAIWPDTKFVFIGYSSNGYPMRVLWFPHATIPKDWPGPAGRQRA